MLGQLARRGGAGLQGPQLGDASHVGRVRRRLQIAVVFRREGCDVLLREQLLSFAIKTPYRRNIIVTQDYTAD
jgi:hypothetical protein